MMQFIIFTKSTHACTSVYQQTRSEVVIAILRKKLGVKLTVNRNSLM